MPFYLFCYAGAFSFSMMYTGIVHTNKRFDDPTKKQGEKMLIIFVRAIVLYILVLIVMRLMGKREIGQMQPFELAISIMIADLATVPMAELGIPLTNGILPILGLLVMHLLISILNLKSMRFREIISRKTTNTNL